VLLLAELGLTIMIVLKEEGIVGASLSLSKAR